jgi:hypothetical protein
MEMDVTRTVSLNLDLLVYKITQWTLWLQIVLTLNVEMGSLMEMKNVMITILLEEMVVVLCAKLN